MVLFGLYGGSSKLDLNVWYYIFVISIFCGDSAVAISQAVGRNRHNIVMWIMSQ